MLRTQRMLPCAAVRFHMLHSDPMSQRRNIKLICKYSAGPMEVIFVAGGWLLLYLIQSMHDLNLTDVDIIQSRVSF